MRTVRLVGLFLSLGLAACGSVDEGSGLDGGGDGGLSSSKAGVFSLFDPVAASPSIPFPNDGLFSGFKDPTLNIPNPSGAPFVTAANLQDGFSTTASLFTDFIGFVDYSTVAANMRFIDTSTLPPTVLLPGVDFTIQPSTAIDATGRPISSYRSRVLIEPLKPLKPSTRYIVALTTGVKSTDGLNATPSDLFRVARSATPVPDQTDPILNNLTSAQKATLEVVRAQLVRPVVAALGAAGLPEANVLIAWSFTTQSTGKTLEFMNTAASAKTLNVLATGLNTAQATSGLAANTGDVYLGTITLPYYLSNAGGDPAVVGDSNAQSTAPLSNFWLADTTQPDVRTDGSGNPVYRFLGQVPCGAFATGATVNGQTAEASASTTGCYPLPAKRTDEKIPVLVTVPNSNSGRTMPTDGWPVVIFQHGITGNRSQMLAIGPTLASAGFVTVAIDLPLHGLTDNTSPLYRNQAFATAAPSFTAEERTFDLDLVNNTTGAPVSATNPPDGRDGSGTHFINLASLITSRDNLRQAVVDLITVAKSLPGTVFLASGAPTSTRIDGTKIYFIGHSLGGIVGTTLLGVNSDIKAATLAMPGGGVAKLLDGSKAFGPRISGGLGALGVTEGTDNYETFMRFAQTLVDSGDPINFAAAAATGHPLHMIEAINDLVVPNASVANSGAGALDRVTLTGFLSGTDPLFQRMGMTVAGPATGLVPPFATPMNCPGANTVVRFGAPANHGSILSPGIVTTGPTPDSAEVQSAKLAVTVEMQRETATFLATHAAGATALSLPVTACP